MMSLNNSGLDSSTAGTPLGRRPICIASTIINADDLIFFLVSECNDDLPIAIRQVQNKKRFLYLVRGKGKVLLNCIQLLVIYDKIKSNLGFSSPKRSENLSRTYLNKNKYVS